MVQLGLIALALLFFWEGANRFRSTGIRVGLFEAGGEPIKGTRGKALGAGVIAVGLVCLFFAVVYILFVARANRGVRAELLYCSSPQRRVAVASAPGRTVPRLREPV